MEKEARFNYTGHGWEGHNYKMDMSLKEIATKLRERVKKEMPDIKWSITIEHYSMGQSLHISLMEAPFEAIICQRRRVFKNGQEEWEESQPEKQSAQLNHYTFREGYEHTEGCSNGTKLTRKAWNVLSLVSGYATSFNFDDSDSQIDYFHTNFYLHLNIGKWDKPFVVTTKTKAAKPIQTNKPSSVLAQILA